jgi:hypothetical protein
MAGKRESEVAEELIVLGRKSCRPSWPEDLLHEVNWRSLI